MWLPDLAWASTVMGVTEEDLNLAGGEEQRQQQKQGDKLKGEDEQQQQELQQKQQQQHDQQEKQQQQQEEKADSSKQQVTWRRLHAMGPRRLLDQQMTLGLLASLSTTQWALQYEVDAAVCGELPVLAVPSFSQPQPYPLLIMQPAPAAGGGGVLLHLWLDEAEVTFMEEAVAAQGGI